MFDKERTDVPCIQPMQILLNANICAAWHLAMYTCFIMKHKVAKGYAL